MVTLKIPFVRLKQAKHTTKPKYKTAEHVDSCYNMYRLISNMMMETENHIGFPLHIHVHMKCAYKCERTNE